MGRRRCSPRRRESRDGGDRRLPRACHARHRAQEFRQFLTRIEAAVAPDLEVHLILDNYATHKTPAIHRWLLRHPRFNLHFTPTSASWLNIVERWCVELTRKQIKRGTHRSTKALRDAITAYIAGATTPRNLSDRRRDPRERRPILYADL